MEVWFNQRYGTIAEVLFLRDGPYKGMHAFMRLRGKTIVCELLVQDFAIERHWIKIGVL